METFDVASDVVVGAVALAGLILVYIGALSFSYATFGATQQPSVRGRYQIRAWVAFVGFAASILAAGLALIGKWLHVECMVSSSIVLLVVALLWSVWITLATIREIK